MVLGKIRPTQKIRLEKIQWIQKLFQSVNDNNVKTLTKAIIH